MRVTVADMDEAGSGDDVYARVLHGKITRKRTKVEWSDWALLDHAGCDNLQLSTTDYFNEFEGLTDAWKAVAVYNCGDDDVIVDSVGVWNGQSSTTIDYFCPNIAGPSTSCNEDFSQSLTVGECFEGYDGSEPFDYQRIDQEDCSAIAFKTEESSSTGVNVATPWIENDPGIPDCTALAQLKMARLNVAHGVATDSSPVMGLEYSLIALVLAIVFVIGLVFAYFRKRANKDTIYQPITKYGSGAQENYA